ncbi:MAG: hypothetical protein NE330_18250 [Lentisphaeraceae bacterium]|nr:hypothetical protein [Lentisphaeraceae bacterium]
MKLTVGIFILVIVAGPLYSDTEKPKNQKSIQKPSLGKKVKICQLPKMVQEIIKLDCSDEIQDIRKTTFKNNTFYTVTTLSQRNGRVNHVFDNRGYKVQ